jgi:hypothetical protein
MLGCPSPSSATPQQTQRHTAAPGHLETPRGPSRLVSSSSLSERTRFGAKQPHFCSKIGRNQGVIACFRKKTSHKPGV